MKTALFAHRAFRVTPVAQKAQASVQSILIHTGREQPPPAHPSAGSDIEWLVILYFLILFSSLSGLTVIFLAMSVSQAESSQPRVFKYQHSFQVSPLFV